jgi:hypothetical protein
MIIFDYTIKKIISFFTETPIELEPREQYFRFSMKCVCDFYHKQKELGIELYDTPYLKEVWKEIIEIVYWYENVYPTYKETEEIPDNIKSGPLDFSENDPYWQWYEKAELESQRQEYIIENMVERVAKIYKLLTYR